MNLLLWWEGTGGAHVELFTVVEGKNILVNDPDEDASLKAYIPSGAVTGETITELPSTGRVAVVGLLPTDGGFSTTKSIELHLQEGNLNSVLNDSVKFSINGESADFTIKTEDGLKKIVHVPVSTGEIAVKVDFKDSTGYERSVEWS